jgi:hypothetical protein
MKCQTSLVFRCVVIPIKHVLLYPKNRHLLQIQLQSTLTLFAFQNIENFQRKVCDNQEEQEPHEKHVERHDGTRKRYERVVLQQHVVREQFVRFHDQEQRLRAIFFFSSKVS